MAKTLKIGKMASNDEPHPTVSGADGSIHINLDKEILSGYERTSTTVVRYELLSITIMPIHSYSRILQCCSEGSLFAVKVLCSQ